MASLWFQVDCELFEHDKFMGLARDCANKKAVAFFILGTLWAWCLKYRPFGVITAEDRPTVEWMLERALLEETPGRADGAAIVDRLVERGFLIEARDGGLTLANWGEYSGRLAHQRAATAERVQRHREKRREADSRLGNEDVTVTDPLRNRDVRVPTVTTTGDSKESLERPIQTMEEAASVDVSVDAVPRAKPSKAVDTRPFAEWWQTYPRKVGKTKAMELWRRARLAGAEEADLLAAAVNYADACRLDGREMRFILHPRTFLGPQEVWRDYVEGVAPGDQAYDEWKRRRREPDADATAYLCEDDDGQMRPLSEILKRARLGEDADSETEDT